MSDPRVLRAYMQVQARRDAQMRALLRRVSSEASRIVRGASSTRRAQILLAQQQIALWLDIKDITVAGAGSAAEAAAEIQALFDKSYVAEMGISYADWKASLEATARAGIDSYLARKQHGMTLSRRVYRNSQLASGAINDLIDNSLLLGRSAREIASDVAKYINPDVPGGVSSAAMRLGRTEINNAFHYTQQQQLSAAPWVTAVKWNLSGSHPKPDVCNEYAETTHYRGGKLGCFKPDEVPGKPHPNCFCYITEVAISQRAFIAAFRRGAYDDFLGNVMAA